MEFSQSDLDQIKHRGSDPEHVQKQFAYFEKGFDFSLLKRPATAGNGILVLEKEQVSDLADRFYREARDKKLLKFVPASGAASRMFKDLFSFIEATDISTEQKAIGFLSQVEKFAFKDDLEKVLKKDGYSLQDEIRKLNHRLIIPYILEEKGLNYANLPKGLLKFHAYPGEIRTAVEEHLVESALYAQNQDKTCYLHFTVSPHHQKLFAELISQVKGTYEKRFGVTYEVSFSIQEPSTDTLAADSSNYPFRDSSGKLLFRPGGHGALLGNLNRLTYDLIFIKNIDNIVPDHAKTQTILYKKALGSYLLELQKQIFTYLQKIERKEFSADLLRQVISFAKEKLNLEFNAAFNAYSEKEKWDFLFAKLNRPLRVCGMVRNTGEPGGGPFWVLSPDGETSLQIVETSQINLEDPQQKEILRQATHFNPVDLVCSFRNYKGGYFSLQDYVDENSGFISSKSYEGQTLKAMELPGLWNGAMANWTTVFVEVPLETFNPVKTVFDLLKR